MCVMYVCMFVARYMQLLQSLCCMVKTSIFRLGQGSSIFPSPATMQSQCVPHAVRLFSTTHIC